MAGKPEIGAIGLNGVVVSLPASASQFLGQVSGPIFSETLIVPGKLRSITPQSQNELIIEFVRQLYDLENVEYNPPA